MTLPEAAAPPLMQRPATAADAPFLQALFAAGRPELNVLPEAQRAPLLALQHRAREHAHRTAHPHATDQVLLLGRTAVGRLLVDRGPAVWTLVDVAVLPAYQGRGIGRRVLTDLQAEAAAAGRPLHLHALAHSPAHRWYLRAGFEPVAEQGLYVAMRWEPPA